MKIDVNTITDMNFIRDNVYNKNTNITVVFQDNSVDMSLRVALLHGILWRPYNALGITLTSNHVYELNAVTTSTVAKIQTIQYKELLEYGVDYKNIVILFWDTINMLYKFIHEHLTMYQKSISVLSLIQLTKIPKINKIISKPIPFESGTKIAETIFEARSKELIQALSDKDTCSNNPLLPLILSGVLNANQIPQLLMAYGTRSDLDDHMMKHIINESALSGLKSIKDYATESLSAKKTAFYLKEVIANTQYFARELRLNNMQFRITHPGHCGSNYLLPITIQKGTGHNYVDKVIYVNGERIEVSHSNCRSFEGTRVEMVSPLGCRHLDGVCERCAGRATNKPWCYMPNVHLGSYAKSKMSSKVSQQVLSAKHLIKTLSIEPKLSDIASEYFIKKDDDTDIVVNPRIVSKFKEYTIIVSCDNISHIQDLAYGDISPEGFSLFANIGLMNNKTGIIQDIILSDNEFMLYFSKDMLNYIRDNLSSIETIDNCYYIPVGRFNMKNPIMSYCVVNDDMVKFSKRIKTMLSTDLSEYGTVYAALSEMTNILYSKTSLNIFWVELILKSLMSDIIDESNGQAKFSKIRDGIIFSSVATKLGHEDIRRYLQKVDTTVVEKGDSPLDIMFGF